MMKWKYNANGVDSWEMALEALLRCRGNMVIPGTDEMSRKNRRLAADMPFWANGKFGRFDTPEAGGRLISDMIKKQCELVKQHVENPVFCTNLYGEIMELYEQGHLELTKDIIKVCADNGFGKMVTRRQMERQNDQR